ncbi:MAG: DUF885 domain-containing protein, partial [Psychroserpens sp.]|nr:DUF885 domain-containing protein [Psychroserpens sp.]
MSYSKFIIVIAFISVFSCQDEVKTLSASEELQAIIDEYQDHEGYDRNEYPLGDFSEEYYKSEAEFAQTQLDELTKIESETLSETEQISLTLLKFVLQDQIDFYEFEGYLNPLLSDTGFHTNLTYEVRPLTNYWQVKEYLKKLNAIPEFVNQNLVHLRAGLEKGVSQPRIIFEGYESTYDTHIVDNYEDSFYYSPFKNLPNDLNEVQKDSVLKAARIAVETNVIPQFKRIKTFFETEYFPKTRTTLGVSETPNGNAYYQNRINYYTTSTQYTADDIHQIGLKEVARIKAEMQTIISELKFKGSFEEFFHFLRTDQQFYAETPEQLLMIARDIAKRADA